MKDERAKKIEEAIKLIYDSLDSHLEWTHRQSSEGRAFHKKCAAEYAQLILILTQLY
jgi:hypothetical protein